MQPRGERRVPRRPCRAAGARRCRPRRSRASRRRGRQGDGGSVRSRGRLSAGRGVARPLQSVADLPPTRPTSVVADDHRRKGLPRSLPPPSSADCTASRSIKPPSHRDSRPEARPRYWAAGSPITREAAGGSVFSSWGGSTFERC